MTRKEIKAEIRSKNKECRDLNDKIMASKDANEVRSLGETLKKIRDEIDELETKLDEVDEEEKIDEERSFNPLATYSQYGTRQFVPGSESLSIENCVDSLALRSNETMVSRIGANNRKNMDLGKYVRGAITGDWTNATEERSMFTTSTMGVIIPSVLSASIIDKARNTSLFTSAGVPIIPMETNNLTIARVSKDPEFKFKGELAEAEESNFELEPVELKAKTAYGYAYCSLETIKSASNLTDILYQVFSQAFADMCDRGILYGQDGNEFAPSGIMNDTSINTILATNHYYDDYIKAIGAVKRANGTPTIIGMNAGTEESISLLKDKNGNYIEEPKSFSSLTKIVTNQLSEDEESGSDALVFDPNAMVIGVQNQLVFRVIQDSDYCIKNGAVGFQIYSMLDCVTTQPKHIAKITGIKENAVG